MENNTTKDFTAEATKLGADQDLVKLYNAGIFDKEPTIGDISSGFKMPTSTDTYGNALMDYNKGLNFDENTVRQNVLKQFQDEINSTKGAYSQLLSNVKQQGLGRLGEDIAVQSRRGLIGSDFGAAQTEKVRALNLSEEQKVAAAQAAALAGIKSQATQLAQSEISSKRAAKQQGTQAYLNYLSGAEERKTKKLETLANALLLQNFDPTTFGEKELSDIAKGYGVTEADIINSYLSRKREQEKEDIEDRYKTVGSGSALVDPITGKVIYQSEKSDSLTPYQQFSATQSIAKDTQKRTENAREMSRQASLIESSYKNIKSGGDRSLNTQAMVTAFNKILDPTSVVRESEYDRTAQGQSLIAQLEGKVQQIATGGAGITDETLQEAANIANQYLAESQASILAENERARAFAGQFGLNPDFVTTGGYTTGTEFEEEW